MECCNKPKTEQRRKGFLIGILYGLAPHTFCIAFIIFTILGATAATAFLKPLLLNRYFFYILIALSFVFATVSAVIYLKRNKILSFQGIKRKWRYLSVLYGITIFVNLLLFIVIFPQAANLNFNSAAQLAAVEEWGSLSSITLKVAIPCSGHAPLIITELNKISGVAGVKFKFPNLFEVRYDPAKISRDGLLLLEIFKEYKATILK